MDLSMKYLSCLILLVGLLTARSDAHSAHSSEGLVIAAITEDYEPRARPVKDPKLPVYVNMTIALNQIIALVDISQALRTKLWFRLDEIEQKFHSKIWFRMLWKDEYLTWNPDEYEGVDMVALDTGDIWRPDIFSYNSLSDERPGYVFDELVQAQVYHDGTVIWVPSAIMESSCLIDVTDYPFDKQSCLLKFGTWTYDNSQVIIHLPDQGLMDSDTIDFLNGEWDLIDCPCKAIKVHTFGQYWSVVECYVNIVRQPLFYVFNLGFPIVLLLAIGGLAFCLPPDSGDKINLSVTIFLALTVFIMVIMDHLPPTSQAIPLLEKFIASCTVLLALSTGTSVIVVSVHTRPTWKVTKPPPRIMQIILLRFVARALCLEIEYESEDNKSDEKVNLESGGRSDVPSEEEQEAAHQTWIKCALVMDRMCCAFYVVCCIIIFLFLVIKGYS